MCAFVYISVPPIKSRLIIVCEFLIHFNCIITLSTSYKLLSLIFPGTVFIEMWKRKAARLAYKWDTDNFELTEPDRPQFAENPKIEIRKVSITFTKNCMSNI